MTMMMRKPMFLLRLTIYCLYAAVGSFAAMEPLGLMTKTNALAARTTTGTVPAITKTRMTEQQQQSNDHHRRQQQQQQQKQHRSLSHDNDGIDAFLNDMLLDDTTWPYPRDYTILSSEEIEYRIWNDYATKFPRYIKVTTAQDMYGLPRAGGTHNNAKHNQQQEDCPYDSSGSGCANIIVTIQDFEQYPENSISSNRLPEVFWSGSLHGNERVGPTAVTEAMGLLLSAAQCESLPHRPTRSTDTEMKQATACREALEKRGISVLDRQWLARLVTTRRLVIMPMANALGYFRNQRTEDGIDANRDFPYDNLRPTDCMQTIAARSINEVFREHMFQLSLTFHGGMEVIAYEWGAPTYDTYDSPDDTAQRDIAQAYSQYAGSFGPTSAYDYGDMNSKVYYVRGGMEDWAYAGSWDTPRVLPCEPTTYGGSYPREKTIYNDSTLRMYNMLVEASKNKTPPRVSLGSTLNPLDQHTAGNGHISRNMRLALLALELVQPYVDIVGVDTMRIQDGISLLQQQQKASAAEPCIGSSILIPKDMNKLSIEWTAAGGLEVNHTALYYAHVRDVDWTLYAAPNDACAQPRKDWHPLHDHIHFHVATMETDNVGTTAWSSSRTSNEGGGAPPQPSESISDPKGVPFRKGPMFRATMDTSSYQPGDQIVVIASVRMDQYWAATTTTTSPNTNNVKPPNIGPQAHLVHARTNPDWYHESANKVIDGRQDYFSQPIIIEIGTYDSHTGYVNVDEEETTSNHQQQQQPKRTIVEVTSRFDGAMEHEPNWNFWSNNNNNNKKVAMWVTASIVTLAIVAVLSVMGIMRRRSTQQRKYQRHVQHENEAFSSANLKGFKEDFYDEDNNNGHDDDDLVEYGGGGLMDAMQGNNDAPGEYGEVELRRVVTAPTSSSSSGSKRRTNVNSGGAPVSTNLFPAQ